MLARLHTSVSPDETIRIDTIPGVTISGDDREIVAELRRLGLYRQACRTIRARPGKNHALVIHGEHGACRAFLWFAAAGSQGWAELIGDLGLVLPLVTLALGGTRRDRLH